MRRGIDVGLLALASTYVLIVQVSEQMRQFLLIWAFVAWLWLFVSGRQRTGSTSLSYATWRPGCGWFLVLEDGSEYPARVGRSTRVFSRLIVLSLEVKGLRLGNLILWPDSIEHNVLRRLRVVLRLADG